jgi:hypothetical protein
LPKWAFAAMKGYLEIRVGGGAIDRFGLFSARTVCEQIILDPPMRIYHQPHEKRTNLYKEKPNSIVQYNLKHQTFKKPGMRDWFEGCIKIMMEKGINQNINGDNWGFAKENLEEIVIPRKI